ncbi:MAG: metallophosphoesterase [Egibacteraceae bacterium]
MSAQPPDRRDAAPRPRTLAALDFRRRAATRWYHPPVLADAAVRLAVSMAFDAFLDKRELQAALAAEVYEVPEDPARRTADDAELWIDYVADTGDGFPATYTIAWLASQARLPLEGNPAGLPRGDLMVLGGDEVYPVANPGAYTDRLTGPYEAALPWAADGGQDVFAIPGNHDWYDGLTSFMRVFGQGAWIGGRRTRQARSYFALRLPHGWWLWGIDIAFDAYVDDPQMRYFRQVRAQMEPGDRVILCTAKPSWVKPHDPGSYRNLAFVERKLLHDVEVPLTIAGDYHHYSRYVGDDGTHKVTAGGGGAFLHPTHGLGDALVLPPHGDGDAAARVSAPTRSADPHEAASPVDPAAVADEDDAGPYRWFRRAAVYPDPATSRRLVWGCLAMSVRNPWFTMIPAALSTVLLWSVLFARRAAGGAVGDTLATTAGRVGFADLAAGLAASPVALLLVVTLLGALVGFARPSTRWRLPGAPAWVPKALLGLTHGVVQVLAFLVVASAATRLMAPLLHAELPAVGQVTVLLALFVVVAALGGGAGGLVMGAYLAAANAAPGHAHGNESFSALANEDHKHFLRLHIDRTGALHLHAIGVDRACRKWDVDPDAEDPEASWLRPAEPPPRARLVDGPLCVHPGRGDGGVAGPTRSA